MRLETLNFFPFDATQLLLALPEIFLLSAVVVILLIDLFLNKPFKELTYYLTQFSLFVSAVLVLNLVGHENTTAFGNFFIIDKIASISKVLIIITTMIVLIYSRHYLKIHFILRSEYFIITLLAVLGMMIMASGYNLLILYLGLEIMSLSLYTLIALTRSRANAIEAALKYFVLGAIASGLLLYGISMIYGISTSLDLSEIAKFATNTNLSSREELIINFGLVFLIIGIAFKLGAVPFHMWIPDVYQGAPTSVTMFLSTAPKIAAVILLIRLLINGLGAMQDYWSQLLIALALLSIILGSLVALVQSNIKRMLAYSTISHVGFILLGFVTGVATGYGAAAFYIFAYILTSLAVFGVIILLNKNGFEAEQISDYEGLNKHYPWFALIMLIAMFSMAGVPPFIGFYAKLLILQQIIEQGYIVIAIIVVVFAVISSYYYLQVIKAMYFKESKQIISIKAPTDVHLMLSINIVLIFVIGLFPNYFIKLAISLF